MFTRRLSDMKKGNRGKVVRVAGQGKVTRRLMDMGLVAGSEVEVKGGAAADVRIDRDVSVVHSHDRVSHG